MAARGQSSSRPHAQDPITVRAPLFEHLVGKLETGGRWVILDLGPARSSIIELLSSYRCRLDVGHLARRLDRLNVDPARASPDRRLRALLPAARGETADIVFCWDLLNYLKPTAIAALMAVLAERAGARILVHALIHYSSPQMPSRPSSWDADGPGGLIAGDECLTQCPAPRYAPRNLLKFMPGWEVERAMLLGNGMQEYLLRLGSEPMAAPE